MINQRAMDRRKFLKVGGSVIPMGGLLLEGAPKLIGAENSRISRKPVPATPFDETADYTLRIGTGLIEVAPKHFISTTIYNMFQNSNRYFIS
jgi:hypothetical protein